MTHIETVGNIKVYADRNPDNTVTVNFYNGSDRIANEVYFHAKSKQQAIETTFMNKLDTFTEEWLWLYCLTEGLKKLSDNTYKTSDTDWFCRIDDTKYFKHFCKSADDFVRDKDGMRIIDR